MKIGEKIRVIRMSKGLTQKDLCSGICSQGMISQIEANKHIPNAFILSKICEKLNVQIDELQYPSDTDLRIKNKLKSELSSLFYLRRYEELYNLCQTKEVNTNFYTKLDRQLIIFYEALYIGITQKNYIKAYEMLETTLYLTYFKNKKEMSYQEILIMCNLGIFLLRLNMVMDAVTYFDLLIKVLEVNKNIEDEPKLTLVFFNIANAFSKLKSYKKALHVANLGIEWANKPNINTQYRLAYLYYEKGFNEEKLNMKSFMESYKISYYLALNNKDLTLIQFIKSKIKI